MKYCWVIIGLVHGTKWQSGGRPSPPAIAHTRMSPLVVESEVGGVHQPHNHLPSRCWAAAAVVGVAEPRYRTRDSLRGGLSHQFRWSRMQ